MPVLNWASHHRLWVLVAGVAALVLAFVGGVWFFTARNPGTQIGIRQALLQYRQNQGAEGASGSTPLPLSGVYRYRTSGGEHLSVGDIARVFPNTTEMIVTDAKCATLEWEPLEQHKEEMVECPVQEGILSMTSALTYEEIAGIQTTNLIQCPSNAYLVPPPSVGEEWHATCHASDQKIALSGQVIGASSVDIGGHAEPALHVRLTLVFSGSETGTNPADYWVSLKDGMILREHETVDVSQVVGPLGSVRYAEQMTITLSSLTPIR